MSGLEPLVTVVASGLANVALKFIEAVSVKIDTKNRKLIVSIDEETNNNTTERLKKLDEARESLIEGLQAIEELKEEANLNKIEADKALQKILELENNKASLEEELQHVQSLIKADVSTFRKVAGISDADIKKERILGFISGVLASIIASIIIGSVVWGFKTYIKPTITEQEPPNTSEPTTNL